jgi:AcrR family transcriptional regulator
MVYTHFGGKSGLLRSLHREGFRRMGRKLDLDIDRLDPSDAFEHLACTFRDFALDDPNMYSAMFGHKSQGFRPNQAACERKTHAYSVLESLVDNVVDRGQIRSDHTRRVTDTLWAFIHGTIALELAGYHEDLDLAEENFIFACRAAFSGVLQEDDPLEAA